MTQVKGRFRLAENIDEALKLLTAKSPKKLKNFRRPKKLWEDDEYDLVSSPMDDMHKPKASRERMKDRLRAPQKSKPVTLASVKWLDKEEK
mgnify:CR=1 FL=1